MRTYQEFLAAKLAPPAAEGFEAEPPRCLLDWQAAVVPWSWRRARCALFEDCGLGKTIQQLAWAHGVVRQANAPVLILAPLGVTYQTVSEGDKFDLPVARISSQCDVKGAGVYITNYQKLHKLDPSAFGGVVLDESSILKDIGGKTRRRLTEAFSETPFRLCCTATPSPNDLAELGNHAEFLGICKSTEMLATFFINDQKHASQKWRLKGHAKSAFYDWLATWSLFLRSPAALGYDASAYELPKHKESVYAVEHDWRVDGLLFKSPAKSLSDLRTVRRNSIEERMVALASLPKNGVRITWCGLNAESSAVAAAFPEAIEIAGRHPNEVKEEALVAFSQGDIAHLVTKASIAGHGMNFQVCYTQDFFGLDHSYESFYQATRRLWRFGQKNEVATRVVLTDVDRHIYETVKKKEAVATAMAEELEGRMEASMKEQVSAGGSPTIPVSKVTMEEGDGWRFYNGDSVEVIRSIDDNSVGYQVMSPPFPEVYTYSDSPCDMGNSAREGEFEEHMGFLAREMLRVSMPGRLATMHCMDLPILKRKAGYIGLMDFPGQLIRIMESVGWRFFARRMIWKDPVIENARTHSLGHGNLLKDSAKSRAGLPDYLVTFQKPGDNPKPIEHSRADFPVEQWQLWASPAYTNHELTESERRALADPPAWMLAPIWYDIVPGDTLQKESAREEADEKHICPLQLTVIERCITMWSAPGDTVTSWFAGIGSEGFVAIRKGRKAILCELKKSYWEQGAKNLRAAEKFKEQLTLNLSGEGA